MQSVFIYEHMKRIFYAMLAIVGLTILVIGVCSPRAQAQDDVLVTLQPQIILSGERAPEESFEVLVDPLDGSPAPLESSSTAVAVSFHEPRAYAHIDFSFDNVGIYTYTIAQRKGTHPEITYSQDTYLVEIETFYNDGALSYIVRAYQDGDKDSKTGNIVFENVFHPMEKDPTNREDGKGNATQDGSQSANTEGLPQATFATTSDTTMMLIKFFIHMIVLSGMTLVVMYRARMQS